MLRRESSHAHFITECQCGVRVMVALLEYGYLVSRVVNLEDTLSITEGGDVSGGVLFVHGLSSHNLDNHVTHDTHHSGTSVVKLNVELAGLLSGVLDVVTEPSDSVVSVVLGGRHPGKLNKGEEEKNLEKSGSGDGTDSINTGGDIGEFKVGRGGKVSVEDDVVVVDNSSHNGSHGNTSVLALDGTTTFEGLRLSVQPSERIVDSKRGGGSKLKLVYHVKGRALYRYILSYSSRLSSFQIISMYCI